MNEAQFLEFLVKEFEDKILSIGGDKVAGFFAEPIMGSGGVIIPRRVISNACGTCASATTSCSLPTKW